MDDNFTFTSKTQYILHTYSKRRISAIDKEHLHIVSYKSDIYLLLKKIFKVPIFDFNPSSDMVYTISQCKNYRYYLLCMIRFNWKANNVEVYAYRDVETDFENNFKSLLEQIILERL